MCTLLKVSGKKKNLAHKPAASILFIDYKTDFCSTSCRDAVRCAGLVSALLQDLAGFEITRGGLKKRWSPPPLPHPPSLHRADRRQRAAQVAAVVLEASRWSTERHFPPCVTRLESVEVRCEFQPRVTTSIIPPPSRSGHLSARLPAFSISRLRRWYLANGELQSCPSRWR